ncbi:MAG: hypothetical protein CBB67_016760 [Alteromonadaceae bacterium TMED7]|uniref:hypothetical protein n=1 Tax=Alteromonas sp. TaxID=232 RepID=UPI000B754033|nr:hypothetical protein [Alteromonas sp.]MAI37906.1 hypothetical protein [Alteromonas sp.]RPH15838.1 MAG: hypothetical protein CBB67_016760 [Alteromonadaceae bacterium TMED7]|tara:strand:- start:9548 stop:10069 length:522 start_codon:yes stop_codon:yes gene_type:complete
MSRLIERDGGDIVSPSIVYQNELPYIRGEFSKTGERVYFSPMDFALNGPKDGDEITKVHPFIRKTLSLKVIERVYSNKNQEVPMYVTLNIKSETDDKTRDLGLVDIIVYLCPEVIERYDLKTLDSRYFKQFAIYPQWWLDDYRITGSSATNDLTRAVSLLTGLCTHTLVSGYV